MGNGSACQLDRAALAAYCGAYGMRAEATEAIQKFGTMVKSPSGYPVQSPYVSIANRHRRCVALVCQLVVPLVPSLAMIGGGGSSGALLSQAPAEESLAAAEHRALPRQARPG